MSHSNMDQPRGRDWLVFALVPLFMSSNLIFGRGLADEADPFVIALIRWLVSGLVMLPFLYRDWPIVRSSLRNHAGLLFAMGFTFIVICGGGVYWSLTLTTASNATLIYTTSPLFVILAERIFAGRIIVRRELTGILLAFVGVVVIVLRGHFGAILDIKFNAGDLGMLGAGMAFAAYSIMLRQPAARAMPPFVLFGLVALVGCVLLLPLSLWDVMHGGLLPRSSSTWSKLAGVIVFASLATYIGFQYTVRVFGPSLASTTLYLMTPSSILMAVIFLGESFQYYHAIGFILVLGGVMLATIRPGSARRFKKALPEK